jgi:hypothetical protein
MEVRLPFALAAPELSFAVEDGGVLEHAAVPTLCFGLRVRSTGEVRSLSLNVQLRIAAPRRPYSDEEETALFELFGRPEQWGRSLQSLHWCNLAVNVTPFTEETLVDLHVPCTYDLEVAATKYLNALRDGMVPLEFLFGGSVFYPAPDGRLQVAPLSWSQEAEYRLPAAVWREAMDRHFPGAAWLRLSRATFDRLQSRRARDAHLSFDETLEALLDERA